MQVVRNIGIENGAVRINDAVDLMQDEKGFNPFAKKVYKHYGIDYPKFYKMSPLSKLGFLASELLLKEVDLSGTDPEKVSVIIANSSASLHTDRIYQETIESKPSPAIFVYTLPNILIGEICIRNGFKGEGIFFIQEGFDKGFIFDFAETCLKSNQSELSLVGWVDMDMEGNYIADLYLLR